MSELHVTISPWMGAAGLGLFVLVEGMFVLIAVGAAVVAWKGLAPDVRGMGWVAAVFAAMSLAGGYYVAGRVSAFTRVTITADGQWVFRNAFRIPLGTIAAGAPREVKIITEERWNLVGSIRQYDASWVRVESGGRAFRSWVTDPEESGRVGRELVAAPGGRRE